MLLKSYGYDFVLSRHHQYHSAVMFGLDDDDSSSSPFSNCVVVSNYAVKMMMMLVEISFLLAVQLWQQLQPSKLIPHRFLMMTARTVVLLLTKK